MSMYLDVYIENSFLGNKTLTYQSGSHDVKAGMRVKVLMNNRELIGFVNQVYPPIPMDYEIAEIIEVLDDEPVINRELFELAEWMKDQTIAPMIRCLQTILPNKLRPQSNAKRIKTQRVVRRLHGDVQGLTPTQKQFLDQFRTDTTLPVKEAQKMYSGFRNLIDKGVLALEDQEVIYESKPIVQQDAKYALTDAQSDILKRVHFNNAHTYLLHGVTGSGKTEIYLQLAHDVVSQGKQVLILVPEISLTPQMIDRVSTRFGEDVAIYHSALNDQEKYEQYMRVKRGDVNIVVGTRSAVFMPFQNLGLIVMDEEHDSSYKQENTPFYHTRDVAIHRSKYHKCPLILGSASPALETYARALKGVYTLLELPERVNQTFPKVTVIDTRQALKNRASHLLTPTLLDGIYDRLQKKQQVMLLLNRRGYMTLLKDVNNEVIQCPNCDVSLNYHKDESSLKCHVCGYAAHHNTNTKGNQNIVGSGVGTQRLEEHLQALFPQARIGRMDADSTRQKNAHEKILNAFMNHETDILVGTQMIAKGLDIENVTLVGIINADTALAHTDYRAVELSFEMLLQASGRAGRGQYPGEVMIQTANPEHYAIQTAIHQKYKHFFKFEMNYRQIANYPPYRYLISIIFSDEDADKAFAAANGFVPFVEDPQIQQIGPVMLRRLNRRHRSRIILKGKDLDVMIAKTHQALDLYKKINRTGVSVDVNPLTLE